MNSKGHLTQEGIEEIVSYKTAMNKGISDKIRASFLNITEIVRTKYVPWKERLEPNWISGFITGDGSFNMRINSKGQVYIRVSICLHKREKLLLERIQRYFSFGSIYEYEVGSRVEWVVYRKDQLLAIRSHFNTYPLGGLKAYNYEIWKQILKLIELKQHLIPEGISRIKLLKQQLNKLS